jgi:hypothetical protein
MSFFILIIKVVIVPTQT